MKQNDIKLEVLICTMADGVQGLLPEAFPKLEGVRYVVAWQRPDLRPVIGEQVLDARQLDSVELPDFLIRDDVRIFVSATQGLSVNRNIALQCAQAPVCLISDDDMSYTRSRLEEVIRAFDVRPDMDVCAFCYDGGEKVYPDAEFDLHCPPRGWYVSSVELAFRRCRIIDAGIWFSEEVGLGAPRYGSGEEDLWLYDALQGGMKALYIPTVIGRHRGLPTGVRKASDASILLAQGYVHGCKATSLAPMRLGLKAFRVWRSAGGFWLRNWWLLCQGWVEGLRARHRRKRYGTKPSVTAPSVRQQIQ